MRKIGLFLLLTACGILLFCAICVERLEKRPYDSGAMPAFELSANAGGEELRPWYDEETDLFYWVLPSFGGTEERSLKIRYRMEGVPKNRNITIDETIYRNGECWNWDGTDTEHEMRLADETVVRFRILASEHLPAIMIRTEDEEDLERIETFKYKKYLEAGNLRLYNESGDLLCDREMERFRVGGHLTAELEKKPFTIRFSSAEDLLGMGPGCEWKLLANAMDGSYLRNKLVLDLAGETIDRYEPKAEYVDLFVNGEYRGNYLLAQSHSVEPGRIEPGPDGVLVGTELDFQARDEVNAVATLTGQTFVIKSDAELSEGKKGKVLHSLQCLENALLSENGRDPESGKHYTELMDVRSFAQAWLIEELSGDHDVCVGSQYLYCTDQENPIWIAGPVWDFDGTFGNVHTPFYAHPECLGAAVEYSRPIENPNQNHWFAAMWRQPEFRREVRSLYEERFAKAYRGLTDKIPVYEEGIRVSADLDELRWKDHRTSWWFLTSGSGTRQEHIDLISDYLERKADFLDRLFCEDAAFVVVTVENDSWYLDQGYLHDLYYWIEPGCKLGSLPEYESGIGYDGQEHIFMGYINAATGDTVDENTIITEDMTVKAVWDGE